MNKYEERARRLVEEWRSVSSEDKEHFLLALHDEDLAVLEELLDLAAGVVTTLRNEGS